MSELTGIQWLLLGLVFLAVVGLILGLTLWFGRRSGVQERLRQMDGPTEKTLGLEGNAEWHAKVVKAVGPMAKLSTPKEGWEESSLKIPGSRFA